MHNPSAGRFEYREGDALAVCEYHRAGDVLDLHHTFVPDSMRGKGVAALLAEEALRYARDNALKVEPTCSYIAVYIRRHPEYAPLLAPGH